MSGISLDERTSRFRGTTTIVGYASKMWKRTFHLFFTCDFSKKCWEHLHIYWKTDLDFFILMERARQQHTTAFFMEIFILGAWLIWKQRNDHIFNRQRPSFSN
jgi:hypothetical protein